MLSSRVLISVISATKTWTECYFEHFKQNEKESLSRYELWEL